MDSPFLYKTKVLLRHGQGYLQGNSVILKTKLDELENKDFIRFQKMFLRLV